MEAYQERVIQEKAELDAKHDKLIAFMDEPRFLGLSGEERERMYCQSAAMRLYSRILGERISAF